MQNLPGARQSLSPAIRAIDVGHKPLAFPALGVRHIGTSAHGKEPVQVHHRSSGLFHQMGRSQTSGHYHKTEDTQLRLAVHNMKVWYPKSSGVRQWKAVRFCAELGIKNYYSSPAHPQSNGQAEVTIRTLKATLKTKLEYLKGKWVEYLPEVLWAYRTTRKSTTQETPFALAFGTEAVAPIEIELKSPRIELASVEHNEEALRLNLDLLDEKRDQVLKSTEDYQWKTARYYDQKVKPRSYKPSDLVLKKLLPARKNPAHGKLGPN